MNSRFKDQDRGLLQFTHDDWQTAIAPKVNGAWNLHEALAGETLDFFVLLQLYLLYCRVVGPG